MTELRLEWAAAVRMTQREGEKRFLNICVWMSNGIELVLEMEQIWEEGLGARAAGRAWQRRRRNLPVGDRWRLAGV